MNNNRALMQKMALTATDRTYTTSITKAKERLYAYAEVTTTNGQTTNTFEIPIGGDEEVTMHLTFTANHLFVIISCETYYNNAPPKNIYVFPKEELLTLTTEKADKKGFLNKCKRYDNVTYLKWLEGNSVVIGNTTIVTDYLTYTNIYKIIDITAISNTAIFFRSKSEKNTLEYRLSDKENITITDIQPLAHDGIFITTNKGSANIYPNGFSPPPPPKPMGPKPPPRVSSQAGGARRTRRQRGRKQRVSSAKTLRSAATRGWPRT